MPDITACLDAIDGTRGKASLIVAYTCHVIPIVTCGGSARRTNPINFVCVLVKNSERFMVLRQVKASMRYKWESLHGNGKSKLYFH
jgi:tRNA A37 threonylcarbamoyladenosine dehydratase